MPLPSLLLPSLLPSTLGDDSFLWTPMKFCDHSEVVGVPSLSCASHLNKGALTGLWAPVLENQRRVFFQQAKHSFSDVACVPKSYFDSIKSFPLRLPWWSSWDLPANAGNTGLVLGLGGFCTTSWGNWAHPVQLLSLHSRACKLQLLKPEVAPQQEKPLQPEARKPQIERSPGSPQLEKVGKEQWRPSAAKNSKQTFLIKKKKIAFL